MKKLSFLPVIALILLSGCTQVAMETQQNTSFPASLAGTWQAETRTWRIRLTTDGQLESFQNHTGVNVLVEDGAGTSKEGAVPFILMAIEETSVNFDSENQKLKVIIKSEMYFDLPGGKSIQSPTTDIFEGSVSADTWVTEWSFMAPVDEGLPQKLITKKNLVFRKLSD